MSVNVFNKSKTLVIGCTEMCTAAAEEKRIGIEKESDHEGVPCISVICDIG